MLWDLAWLFVLAFPFFGWLYLRKENAFFFDAPVNVSFGSQIDYFVAIVCDATKQTVFGCLVVVLMSIGVAAKLPQLLGVAKVLTVLLCLHITANVALAIYVRWG